MSKNYVMDVFDHHLEENLVGDNNPTLIAALLTLATVIDTDAEMLNETLQRMMNYQ